MNSQTLYIYTERLFFYARLKRLVKIVLGKKMAGPLAVEESLCAGLNELGVPYEINSNSENVEVACVLSGVKTLEWAIEQKRKGKIKKIIAGPNIVVSPQDHNAILIDPAIDTIVVPSQWVKESYAYEAPEISDKIKIWPAGVSLPTLSHAPKTVDFLIYNKVGDSPLYRDVRSYLDDQGLHYRTVKYGSFQQEDFFKTLEEARYVLYLSATESQGLAMFEAWARNVPVLAWEPGKLQRRNFIQTGAIATPYISSETGMRFKNLEEFKKALSIFLSTDFHPRKYVEQNFTNKRTAEKYLEIGTKQ